LEKISKKEALATFTVLPEIYLDELRRLTTNLRIVGVQTEVRTEYFPSTKLRLKQPAWWACV
jgi:hypothetical protein